MNSKLQHDRQDSEVAELDRQLAMYARIKELYNIDFDLQVNVLERRVSHLQQAQSRQRRRRAI